MSIEYIIRERLACKSRKMRPIGYTDPLVQRVHGLSMVVNQLGCLSAIFCQSQMQKKKSLWGYRAEQARGCENERYENLLVEEDGEAIIMVPAVGVAGESELPEHVGHSLLEANLLPSADSLCPCNVGNFSEVFEARLRCQPAFF